MQPVITLLEYTSRLVQIANDTMPILSLSDERISTLKRIASYFCQFEKRLKNQSFTSESLYDIQSAIGGFLELCIHMLPKRHVIPAFINSDIIENHFCLVRTMFSGPNTNPNYLHYMSVQNSIVLTQPVALTNKRNAQQYVEPYNS